MNTNIRTVSVHGTLFGRVANNLEVGQLSRAVEPWFADFHDSRVKQAIADLDEPARRGAAAEYLGLELSVVAGAVTKGPTSSACRPLVRLRFCCSCCATRVARVRNCRYH